MRNAIVLALFLAALPLSADDDLTLAREMLEDVVIRNDVVGMDLARDRLLRIAAGSDDRTAVRDAYHLAALSALFESFSGALDTGSSARIVSTAVRHADRAIELDPKFADAWIVSAMLRGAAPTRIAKALELNANSPAVAFFDAVMHSLNPAGAAPAGGVKMFDDLVARLDAERAATGRRFGLWDAEASAWQILVRIASDEPRGETLRAMSARLVSQRPDFALAHDIAGSVAERRFVAPPAIEWHADLTDAANDGRNPALPDVIAVDRGQTADRAWFRVRFREPLPRSFGVNLVINRSGDPSTGMRWWGSGSNFRFDRLVTAWISRDGDRYFGRVGVTDDDGARGSRLMKIPADVALAMSDDARSVMIGVPRDAVGLTDRSAVIVAGGSHLVWNDDATSPVNSR